MRPLLAPCFVASCLLAPCVVAPCVVAPCVVALCLVTVGCGGTPVVDGGAGDAGPGPRETDAGTDAGQDAGYDGGGLDAGWDAGPPPCPLAVFEPAAFGAIGDGVADDGPALRMALEAAAAEGGSVVLDGASTYLLGSAVDASRGRAALPIAGARVSLIGNGARLRVADGVNPEALLMIAGTPEAPASDIRVEGLVVESNYPGNPSGVNYHGIEVRDARHVLLDGVDVFDSRTSISIADRAAEVVVRRSTVTRYEHDGFEVSGTDSSPEDDPHHVVFLECEAREPGFDNDWEIEDGAHDVWVIDSVAERRLFIRNHANEDRITRDIVFVRSAAMYYQLFGYERANDGTPLVVNWVDRISFFNATGLVADMGVRTREVRVEDMARIDSGQATLPAGATSIDVASPLVGPTSLELAFVATQCAEGVGVRVGERRAGAGFTLVADRASPRDLAIEWYVVDGPP